MHGGHMTMLDVKDGTAYIEMGGGCRGCGMRDVTLLQWIEHAIRDHVPEITQLVDRTNHAAGRNPYFPIGGSSKTAPRDWPSRRTADYGFESILPNFRRMSSVLVMTASL